MNELLIRNADWFGRRVDLLVSGGVFTAIEDAGSRPEWTAERVLDAHGNFITPAFYNLHTHAAMTLMRGFADDLELMDWLSHHIWPLEAKLTETDVETGTKLGILEMIRSGTVYFNDMYWFQTGTLRAVEALGVRATLGMLYIAGADGKVLPRNAESNARIADAVKHSPAANRVSIAHAPHAIYTVPEPLLREIADHAGDDGRLVHIHLAETAGETADCRAAHHGLSPLGYLDSLGLVNAKLVAAHCTDFDANDLALAARRGMTLVHMPCSNLKLGSGIFPLAQAQSCGCQCALGTDGASSNNSLSMLDEMKFAALVGKHHAQSVTAVTAKQIFRMATIEAAQAAGINGGEITVGKVADAVLWDKNAPALVGHDLISDLVYAAAPDCTDSVICNGKVLMENKHIPGEAQIIAEARECIAKLKTLAK